MLIEKLKFVKGLDPVADAFSGTVTSDVVSMRNYDTCLFIIHIGVGATGTSTITVLACDDVTPTTTNAVAFHYREITTGDTEGALTAATTSGFTTTAGSSKIVLVEVNSKALGADGYEFVQLSAAESVDSPVLGGITIVLGGGRFQQATKATAIV